MSHFVRRRFDGSERIVAHFSTRSFCRVDPKRTAILESYMSSLGLFTTKQTNEESTANWIRRRRAAPRKVDKGEIQCDQNHAQGSPHGNNDEPCRTAEERLVRIRREIGELGHLLSSVVAKHDWNDVLDAHSSYVAE
jgi:hypothetical protein